MTLEDWLHHEGLKPRSKLLLVLASADGPLRPREIIKRAGEAGWHEPGKSKFNVSARLSECKGLAIRLPEKKGWKITCKGKQHLEGLGFSGFRPSAENVKDIWPDLSSIKCEVARSRAEEAMNCYGAKAYRAAVIMSWIGAVHVLRNYVDRTGRLKDSSVKTSSALNEVRDSEFLEKLEDIEVIDKDVKKVLEDCLALRNSCSHPNSRQIGIKETELHVEKLRLNVFARF